MKQQNDPKAKEALDIVSAYERLLLEKMAAEIVERKDEFDSPFVGGAEQLMDKYQQMLACLCWVKSGLQGQITRVPNRPRVDESKLLGKDEFRCFSCRSIIPEGAEACQECGWTWT